MSTLEQRAGALRQRNVIAHSAEQELSKMQRIAAMEVLACDEPAKLQLAVDDLRRKIARSIGEITANASPFERFSRKRREMYEKLFDLVYSCSTNRTAAKTLIIRMVASIIMDEFSR